MKKLTDLFEAEASSPSETAIFANGAVGFRIPEYQREYDWSAENIDRLFTDCLSGFHRLGTSIKADAFTFLGTLVLVKEGKREADFSGTSVAVVDGQQRLTTLTLLACALYEQLLAYRRGLDQLQLSPNAKGWLAVESDERLVDLLECVAGRQRIKGNQTYPFPRIIRAGDHRGRSGKTSEYRSPLAKLLCAFTEFANLEAEEFVPPSFGSGNDAQKLASNYAHIEELVRWLNDEAWYEETECEQVSVASLGRAGYRSLLDRLGDVIGEEADQNRTIAEVSKCVEAHGFVRTLLFAAYFCRCIVLTRVMTDDEDAAFDIFDALNTTGEPLTALETLKPRVIQFEKSQGGFDGTSSATALLRLRQAIDEQYAETSRKQRETKELIVSFALFIEGSKLPEHLAAQRNFLRTRYERAQAHSRPSAQRFITALADLGDFRRYYWTKAGIEELARFHTAAQSGEVQLLMSFVRDTQTKLALPILARYWSPELKSEGGGEFLAALRAVSAFLLVRRAASGGTSGIDSDLRAVMAPKNGSSKKFGLCAGIESENQRLSIVELRAAFRKLLATSRFKIEGREKWVGQVLANPLYEQAKGIARFMLLAAGHHAMPSPNKPGCWTRDGVKPSAHINNFLNYETWKGGLYETVEHIAPESEPKDGWDPDIYKNMILRHSLGNLILLPKKENGAIGNGSWKRKRVFYQALTESTTEEQEKRIQEVEAQGTPFPVNTKQLLKSGEMLPLLDPLREVDIWSPDIIEARARNTAELTWDLVWPWLA